MMSPQRLAQLHEQLTRDIREYPMGQHEPTHFASPEEQLELVTAATHYLRWKADQESRPAEPITREEANELLSKPDVTPGDAERSRRVAEGFAPSTVAQQAAFGYSVRVRFSCASCGNSSEQAVTLMGVSHLQAQLARYAEHHCACPWPAHNGRPEQPAAPLYANERERWERAPIPMFLTCPKCNARHIDEGEFATKPHHTHSCQSCGLTWRPAVCETVGVLLLPGFKSETSEPKLNNKAPAPVEREILVGKNGDES